MGAGWRGRGIMAIVRKDRREECEGYGGGGEVRRTADS